MKIGFCVEGSTDRAFISGLKERWCPQAELVEGRFRGSTGLSLRREINKICLELNSKGCDIFVFLTDSNNQTWREVLRGQIERVPNEFRYRALCGVAERNIECWLCADADWIANRTGKASIDFRVDDPKSIFNKAMGVSARDSKETEIASLIADVPMKNWIARSESFAAFYREARRIGNSINCLMPDEQST
jgi:hypothetical protein